MILIIDERAILFEKERVKLKKGLQSVVGVSTVLPISSLAKSTLATSNSGIAATSKSFSKFTMNELDQNQFKYEKKELPSPTFAGVESLMISPRANAALRQSIIQPMEMTKKSTNQIYHWETGRDSRIKIDIDECSYVPTKSPGIYSREEEVAKNNKWLDVKIVLTADELETLVKRKQAMKRVKNQGLNLPNQGSIQSSTPYVDPRRIQREIYRPDQPHKWIQPAYNNKVDHI